MGNVHDCENVNRKCKSAMHFCCNLWFIPKLACKMRSHHPGIELYQRFGKKKNVVKALTSLTYCKTGHVISWIGRECLRNIQKWKALAKRAKRFLGHR